MGTSVSLPFHPQRKGPSRKTLKGRKARHERAVKQNVRALCVRRDGVCRLGAAFWSDDIAREAWPPACAGPSEWAHLAGYRRSQTRGMAAESRHTTTYSLMLCKRHHGMEERGELKVIYLSDRGCDGPLRFTV